jgi:sigma-70-like protein
VAESSPHSTGAPVSDAALHARLLGADPTAPADLAVQFLPALVTWLLRTYPRLDAHLLESLAIDLILKLAQSPEQYDPDRGSLTAYLRMAARGDVRNALTSLGRQARRIAPLESVEVAADARNRIMEHNADPAELVAREIPAIDPETLARIRARFDSTEWQVVQLMLEGERHTSAYAAILHLRHLPDLDQAREVKRVKDRLTKRLQRLASTIRRDV